MISANGDDIHTPLKLKKCGRIIIPIKIKIIPLDKAIINDSMALPIAV